MYITNWKTVLNKRGRIELQLFSVYKLRDNIPEELSELKADGDVISCRS